MVDLTDVQGLVARGYVEKLPYAAYLLMRVIDPTAAAARISDLVPRINTSQKSPDSRALNIAFTYDGLQRLGLDQSCLGSFSRPFIEGLVEEHRSRMLGDVGADAPEKWSWYPGKVHPIDVLVMIFAVSNEELTKAELELVSDLRGALEIVKSVVSEPLPGGIEHFGFADGASQPIIQGFPSSNATRRVFAEPPVPTGEFLLGYTDGYDALPATARTMAVNDPNGILHEAHGSSTERDLGRNGTYLVVRQLAQHVQLFWSDIDRHCQSLGQNLAEHRELAAAKMVGRWKSGAPLVKSPTKDNPAFAKDNDFGYREDPKGLACPFGAHIRRANPRDALTSNADSSLMIVQRHRLLRRGRPYGPMVADYYGQEDGIERGLMFICLNANIERQFEFVQSEWFNNPTFGGLYDETDPLLGEKAKNYGTTMSIQGEPMRTRVCELRKYVTVAGGGYFFLPSIRALSYVASLKTRNTAVAAAGRG